MFLKKISLSLLTLGMSTFSFANDSDLTKGINANDVPEGFVSLFDGKKTDTHFKALIKAKGYDKPNKRRKAKLAELAELQKKADARMKKHWSVATDGSLLFDGKGFSLATRKEYADFELSLKWKIEAGGDSGLYLRGLPQVQIWDVNDPKSQRFGSAKGSGGLWNNKKEGRWPLVIADKAVGEWNQFFIRMVGSKVTIHLNGKLIVNNATLENLWEKKKAVPAQGQIELQAHGHKVWFKDIYVRELKK